MARPLAFKLRAAVNQGPKISPRLKVLSFDDEAVSTTQSLDVPVEQWARLFRALDQQNPRTVYIDQVFSFLDASDKRVAEFNRGLQRIDPAVLGAFVLPRKLAGRPLLDVDTPPFNASHYEGLNDWLAEHGQHATLHPYGPSKRLERDSYRAGHLHYDPTGSVRPFLNLGAGRAVPYFGIADADSVAVRYGDLWIDERRVPLADGQVPVNFFDPARAYGSTYSMKDVFRYLESDWKLEFVKPGDTVLILPGMYTGNPDFKETPFGPMPGGLIHQAFLNSRLTDQWLTEVSRAGALTILGFCVFAGALLAAVPGVFTSLVLLGTSALLCIAVGLYAFIGMDFLIPWATPVLGLLVNGTLVLGLKYRNLEHLRTRTLEALKGLVPPKVLARVLQEPDRLAAAPEESTATVMFIDMVGFSSACEAQTPRDAFRFLEGVMDDMSEQIFDHHGFVDRSLGDGLLAWFGPSLFPGEGDPAHADTALRCAEAIQRTIAARCREAAQTGEPVIPVRIGINTGTVYIGNVGGEKRYDLTIVGHSVNFASRLEAACQPFRVIIGTSTKALLHNVSATDSRFKPIKITAKHYPDPIEAFEWDPLAEEAELREEAEAAWRVFRGTQRDEERLSVPDGAIVTGWLNDKPARPINISSRGMAVLANDYYAPKTTVDVSCEVEGSGTTHSITYEVMWSRPDEEGFLHGLRAASSNQHRAAVLKEDLLRQIGHSPEAEEQTPA